MARSKTWLGWPGRHQSTREFMASCTIGRSLGVNEYLHRGFAFRDFVLVQKPFIRPGPGADVPGGVGAPYKTARADPLNHLWIKIRSAHSLSHCGDHPGPQNRSGTCGISRSHGLRKPESRGELGTNPRSAPWVALWDPCAQSIPRKSLRFHDKETSQKRLKGGFALVQILSKVSVCLNG